MTCDYYSSPLTSQPSSPSSVIIIFFLCISRLPPPAFGQHCRLVFTHMVFSYKRFCTRKFLHREAFTQRTLATNDMSDVANRNFTSVFALRPSFRANRLHLRCQNRNFASVFDVRPSFRAKGLHLRFQNQNFTPVLTFDLNFVRKGSIRSLKIAILHQFFDMSVWRCKIAMLHQFLPFDLHFVRKGCACSLKIATLFVCDIRPSFRATGQRHHPKKSHDPRRGLVPCDTRRKPHFTTCLCAGHARSPQQGCLSPYVCASAPEDFRFAFHHTFVRPTRTISAEGHVSQTGFWLPCRLKRECRRTWEIGVCMTSDTSRPPWS
jgi:hypothetical protein